MALPRSNHDLLIPKTVGQNIFPFNTTDWFTHGEVKLFRLFLTFLPFCECDNSNIMTN